METRQPMINTRHALLLARARYFARCRARLARDLRSTAHTQSSANSPPMSRAVPSTISCAARHARPRAVSTTLSSAYALALTRSPTRATSPSVTYAVTSAIPPATPRANTITTLRIAPHALLSTADHAASSATAQPPSSSNTSTAPRAVPRARQRPRPS